MKVRNSEEVEAAISSYVLRGYLVSLLVLRRIRLRLDGEG